MEPSESLGPSGAVACFDLMVIQPRLCPLCVYVLDVCRVIELLDRLQRSGELPPPKLQALQRVLQSKFCAAIREVQSHS